MGGKSTTTRSEPSLSPQLERLLGQRADLLGSQMPDLQRLFTSLQGGENLALAPYTAGAIAPIEHAGAQAQEKIRRTMAPGGSQAAALANSATTTALQRGQLQSQLAQSLLQTLLQIVGDIQTPTGRTETTKQSSGLGGTVNLGPLGLSF
jgi:hypothetical protein